MEKLARREYDREVDKKVKEELQIACIPVLELPCWMGYEVKTRYIGILNGFVFYRAWAYWICHGDMPMDVANYIYDNYKDLNIRAGSHCENVEPEVMSYNPIYRKELKELMDRVTLKEYMEQSKYIVDDKSLPRFVDIYYIDKQIGLCKLAEIIKDKNVKTEMIKR